MHATGSAGHGLRAGMDADKKENTFECFKTNKSNAGGTANDILFCYKIDQSPRDDYSSRGFLVLFI